MLCQPEWQLLKTPFFSIVFFSMPQWPVDNLTDYKLLLKCLDWVYCCCKYFTIQVGESITLEDEWSNSVYIYHNDFFCGSGTYHTSRWMFDAAMFLKYDKLSQFVHSTSINAYRMPAYLLVSMCLLMTGVCWCELGSPPDDAKPSFWKWLALGALGDGSQGTKTVTIKYPTFPGFSISELVDGELA